MVSGTSSSGLACAECGAELPSTSKFCLECGTPVPTTTDRETRRTVTLLFTDVTGSTAMGEQLDPEAYRSVMGRYFAVARAAIERHGGTVEKFVGDAVLAVFGVPEVREDDALRAVRAAYELNSAVAELSDRLAVELGVRLEIRTGVNTGAVVTGSARAGGSFATGDAVNTAARLEQAAGPGEILLGGTTYSLVRDAVRAEPVAPVAAKGKAEPVPAHRLVAVLDAVHGRRRREDVPLVGRSRESRALDDALDRTTSSGRSHLITVVGPPGIGKSRLVSEFLARVGDRADVAYGRCVSYGQGITYWPLVQALRDALHLAGTESEELTRHALDQALGQAHDRAEVVDLLLPLLGKSGVPGGTEQTFWSVRRLLEELATRRPLVLSIDDLHWAEPTLLDLLERVRDEVSDLPLLLLCQARPELLEQHPAWGHGALNSLTFGLDPLNGSETGVSVTALLGGEPPDGLAEVVTTWSGGNPLFVEEIVAHLVESGILRPGDDAMWRVVGDLDEARLPPTVSALLASRLDRLPEAERELLERLSVIGLEFSTADAELLLPHRATPELVVLLASLTRRDLARRVRTPAGDSWAFKHAMVREAAYDGLAKTLRAELHERFADGLVSGDEAGGEQAGLVAHHLEQAARYRRELGVRGAQVEALLERAVRALVTAADEARDRECYEIGIAYLKRALDLGPDTSSGRREILFRLVCRQYEEAQFDLVREALDTLASEMDDTAGVLDRAFLRAMQSAYAMSTADLDPAQVSLLAHELIALARQAGATLAVVTGLRILADCSVMAALWRDADSTSDEIIRIGSPADVRAAWTVRGAALMFGEATMPEARAHLMRHELATGHTDRQRARSLMVGAMVAAASRSEHAEAELGEAVRYQEELLAAGIGTKHPFLISAFALNRDLDGGIAYAEQVNEVLRRVGDTGHASTYILEQAMLMLERGDPAESVLPLVEEAEGYTSPYDAISVSFAKVCRAILAVRAGEHDRATALAAQAIELIDRTHQLWQRADARRYLSEVPRVTADVELERRLLMEAREMYRRKAIDSYDAELLARLAELGDTSIGAAG
jgi:class 3 adenylate cyclase